MCCRCGGRGGAGGAGVKVGSLRVCAAAQSPEALGERGTDGETQSWRQSLRPTTPQTLDPDGGYIA
jgi:hypothetical protein